MNQSKVLPVFVLYFIIFIFLSSCVPKPPESFNNFQKLTYVTTKELIAAVDFRDAALSSAGEFYKRGLMDEDTKNKIIEIGDILYVAINDSREVLKLYFQQRDYSSELSLNQQTLIYREIYNRFSKMVYPYLLKRKDKEEVIVNEQ